MNELNSTPKKGMGTGVKLLIGCVILIVLGVLCVCGVSMVGLAGVSEVADEVEKGIEEEENRGEDAFNNPKNIGDVVTVNDVQWTMVEAKDLGSTLQSKYGEYGDDCVANSGKYIQIRLKVKNNSKDMVSVFNLNLYDSEKREYVTSSEVYGCIDEDIFILDNINPGIEKTFVGVYEVPADATGLRIKVGDLDLFDFDYQYISLGL